MKLRRKRAKKSSLWDVKTGGGAAGTESSAAEMFLRFQPSDICQKSRLWGQNGDVTWMHLLTSAGSFNRDSEQGRIALHCHSQRFEP